MKRRKPVNRLSQPPPDAIDDQEVVKQFLKQTAENKRADQAIRVLQERHPSKSLIQLLPLMNNPKYCSDKRIVRRLVERIERNQGRELSFEDRVFLNDVKKGLEEDEKEKEKCHELRRCPAVCGIAPI